MTSILTTFDHNNVQWWPCHALQAIINTKRGDLHLYMVTDEESMPSLKDAMSKVEKMASIVNPAINVKMTAFNIDEYDGIRINEVLPEDGNKYITRAAYWRLYASALIDEPRTIYLDLDTLIRKDPTELFKMDIKGRHVAMGLDYSHRDGYMDDAFCSGVQLMDLEKMRKDKSLQKMSEWSFSHKFRKHDQDIINACLDIFKLPTAWQCAQFDWWVRGYDPIDPDPNIVHFIYNWKPWKNRKLADRSLFDEWQSYMRLYDAMSHLIEVGRI